MDEAPVGITISDPDRTDNPLVYANAAFERITGYPRDEVLGRNCRFLQGPATAEEPVAELRRAIDAGEPTTVELRNYRKDGEAFWNEVTVAPLYDDGEITHYVGFQSDVSRRKAAERALSEERERLDTLLDRVDALLRTVTEAIVTSTSRSMLERSVCEGLIAVPPYDSARMYEIDAAAEALVPSTTAGGAEPDPVPLEADHPIAQAHRSDEVQGINPTGAVVAIPLAHGGTDYGVLALEVAPAGDVEEREGTVLAALGQAVAAALGAIETRRVLTADELVEAELSVTDEGLFFVRLSTALDCRLTYEGAVADAAEPSLFFAVEGVPSGDVVGEASADPEVAAATVVAEDEAGALLEFELATDALVGQLAAYGADTRSIVVEHGEARVGISLPAGADLRGVVEGVQST
ncbi:MAG: bacterio-opsin activator domain-containing protein, partial [Halorientalis sp.]